MIVYIRKDGAWGIGGGEIEEGVIEWKRYIFLSKKTYCEMKIHLVIDS